MGQLSHQSVPLWPQLSVGNAKVLVLSLPPLGQMFSEVVSEIPYNLGPY